MIAHVSTSSPNSTGLKRKRHEASITLFKCLIDPSDYTYLAFPNVSLDPSPDELFGMLKSKVAGLDLLGVVEDDLPVLTELRELLSKLIRPGTPAVISAFALDLELLLDQAVSVTKLKRSSASLVEEKLGALSQKQDIMSQFEKRFAYWEANIHDQATLISLDKEI